MRLLPQTGITLNSNCLSRASSFQRRDGGPSIYLENGYMTHFHLQTPRSDAMFGFYSGIALFIGRRQQTLDRHLFIV